MVWYGAVWCGMYVYVYTYIYIYIYTRTVSCRCCRSWAGHTLQVKRLDEGLWRALKQLSDKFKPRTTKAILCLLCASSTTMAAMAATTSGTSFSICAFFESQRDWLLPPPCAWAPRTEFCGRTSWYFSRTGPKAEGLTWLCHEWIGPTRSICGALCIVPPCIKDRVRLST